MKNIARPNNLDLMALRHVSAPCRTFRFVGSRSFSAMGYAIYVVLVPLLSGRVPKKKYRFILILNVIIVVLVCVYLLSAHDCVT